MNKEVQQCYDTMKKLGNRITQIQEMCPHGPVRLDLRFGPIAEVTCLRCNKSISACAGMGVHEGARASYPNAVIINHDDNYVLNKKEW